MGKKRSNQKDKQVKALRQQKRREKKHHNQKCCKQSTHKTTNFYINKTIPKTDNRKYILKVKQKLSKAEKCIICDNQNQAKSVEHIVPESLGNKSYLVPRNAICDDCNHRFSKFEDKAISNSVLSFGRTIRAIPTKKGKKPSGLIDKKSFSASDFDDPGLIEIKNFPIKKDSKTGTLSILVPTVDKSSEISLGKLLLKIGIEALYTSLPNVFSKYDFTPLKEYLKNEDTRAWAYICTAYKNGKYKTIPTKKEKREMAYLETTLEYQESSSNTLLFRFYYVHYTFIINLLTRDISWALSYKKADKNLNIFPKQFEKKLDI